MRYGIDLSKLPEALRLPDRVADDYIVLHCTATPPDMNGTVQDIDRWHRENKPVPFAMVGYQFSIRLDGTVDIGRPFNKQGAHARGVNSRSVGIVMWGGINNTKEKKPTNTFTPAQWAALRDLVSLCKAKMPNAQIVGHNFFEPSRGCPSFDVESWLRENGFKDNKATNKLRPIMRMGARGDWVSKLQRKLKLNVDGIFGPVTHAAVVRFQKEASLTVDGIVGPKTWEALEARA
jgi:hypothetical protein